ncbi:hypothetical protein HK102_005796, partial [Quaeritorhiza haematococci]
MSSAYLSHPHPPIHKNYYCSTANVAPSTTPSTSTPTTANIPNIPAALIPATTMSPAHLPSAFQSLHHHKSMPPLIIPAQGQQQPTRPYHIHEQQHPTKIPLINNQVPFFFNMQDILNTAGTHLQHLNNTPATTTTTTTTTASSWQQGIMNDQQQLLDLQSVSSPAVKLLPSTIPFTINAASQHFQQQQQQSYPPLRPHHRQHQHHQQQQQPVTIDITRPILSCNSTAMMISPQFPSLTSMPSPTTPVSPQVLSSPLSLSSPLTYSDFASMLPINPNSVASVATIPPVQPAFVADAISISQTPTQLPAGPVGLGCVDFALRYPLSPASENDPSSYKTASQKGANHYRVKSEEDGEDDHQVNAAHTRSQHVHHESED